MTTKEMIIIAKSKGFTIKSIAEMTDIKVSTIYNFTCNRRNLSREKEEKIRNVLTFLLDL